jgi:hypothetical protein
MRKTLIILGIVAIPLIILIIKCISVSNQEVDIRNMYKAKIDGRSSYYDNKIFKEIKQVGSIALRNDSSFRMVVNSIMAGRKDSEGLAMKWITESNPAAQFTEVSAAYRELSRTVSANRDGFVKMEEQIQEVVRQHDNLLDKFPGNIWLVTILGRKHLEYKPITSDRMEEINKTSKDNDIGVF